MKQLLIVNSSTTANAKAPAAYDTLAAGEIAFFQVLNGVSTKMSAGDVANGNFGIALGRPNGQVPFMIPEVDVKTLTYTKAAYDAGARFKRTITSPSSQGWTIGTEYELILVKKGTVPHERNTWHFSSVLKTTPSSSSNQALNDIINAITNSLGDKFTCSTVTGGIQIEAKNVGDQWALILGDTLKPLVSVVSVEAEPAIGDFAYITELASKCAAGKGFTDTYADGATTIPGYPEAVEPNVQYTILTLRFAVPRVAAKTRDEVVNQVVHIACTSTQAGVIEGLITPASSSSSSSNG